MTYVETDHGQAVGADIASRGLFYGALRQGAAPPGRFHRNDVVSTRVLAFCAGVTRAAMPVNQLRGVCQTERWHPPHDEKGVTCTDGDIREDLPFRDAYWLATWSIRRGKVTRVHLQRLESSPVCEAWCEWQALGDVIDGMLAGPRDIRFHGDAFVTEERWLYDGLEYSLAISERPDSHPVISLEISATQDAGVEPNG